MQTIRFMLDFVCVCTHMWCVYIWGEVHACMCLHMRNLNVNLRCCSSGSVHLTFLRQGLPFAWPRRIGCWSVSPRDLPVPASQDWDYRLCSWLFHMGSEDWTPVLVLASTLLSKPFPQRYAGSLYLFWASAYILPVFFSISFHFIRFPLAAAMHLALLAKVYATLEIVNKACVFPTHSHVTVVY